MTNGVRTKLKIAKQQNDKVDCSKEAMRDHEEDIKTKLAINKGQKLQ